MRFPSSWNLPRFCLSAALKYICLELDHLTYIGCIHKARNRVFAVCPSFQIQIVVISGNLRLLELLSNFILKRQGDWAS